MPYVHSGNPRPGALKSGGAQVSPTRAAFKSFQKRQRYGIDQSTPALNVLISVPDLEVPCPL